ncbi:MAG TPA: hypothetical protein VGO03_16425 [Acidimicrobiia bacterium]
MKDLVHEPVLDARCTSDVALALAVRSQPEDLAHNRRHVVRHELFVDQIVTGLRSVDPLTFTHRLRHAHAHVLGQLLSVELCERSEHCVEHAARC